MQQTFIVFSPEHGQFITHADTWIRAIQNVLAVAPGVAADYIAHRLDSYPAKWQSRLLADSLEV